MISIIVPVYNIENYINKCIDSIINQTYKDIEIILVDDGSTDRSGNVCDDYEKKDKRIKVIHKTNGGLSDARNAGIDVAQGDFLGFIDGDDYIHPQMFEILLDIITKSNSDIAICSYEKVEEYKSVNDIEINKSEYKEIIIQDKELYSLVTNLRTEDVVAWNKLYRKNIFENLRYNKDRLHEDQWLIPYIVHKCKKIVKVETKLYYYVERVGSITKSINTKRIYDLVESLLNTCKLLNEWNQFEEQQLMARHLLNIIIDQYSELNGVSNKKEIRKKLVSYFNQGLEQNMVVFSSKPKIYTLFQINPILGIIAKKSIITMIEMSSKWMLCLKKIV